MDSYEHIKILNNNKVNVMRKKRRYIIVMATCILCFFGIIYFIVPKILFYTQMYDNRINVAIKNATDIHDLLEEAIHCIEKRQYYSAIKLYQKVVQDYPYHKKTEGAQHAIGSCYEWAGNYKKAKEAYNIFMKKYPDSKLAEICRQHVVELDNPIYRKVNDAMVDKPEQLDKIIKKCQKIVNNSSGQKKTDAMLKMGECYFLKKEYLMAIEIYQEIISNYPDYSRIREVEQMIGVCQGLLGNYGKR